MPDRVLPRYPVYVPSYNRWQKERALTVRCLEAEGVPFRVVCQEKEREQYEAVVGEERLLVLPEDGTVWKLWNTRCWIMEHSIAEGHERHWQLDDNIRRMRRSFHGKRIPAAAGLSLRVCEDFTDRWTNVALSGLNYVMFGFPHIPPFHLNAHVYSCTLVNNAITNRWRLIYNDDTDLCLQVLADGWCTVLLNAFLCEKVWTMSVKGGNTDDLYQGDGRAAMARALQRKWPYVVETGRRWSRSAHMVRDGWKRFDTQLIARPVEEQPVIDYQIDLVETSPVRSEHLKAMRDAHPPPRVS